MDIELNCVCGNPACAGRVGFRVGYVQIHHPDGTDEVRWDYLHIDAFSGDGEGSKEGDFKWVEAMCNPEQGKDLMWYLVWEYMPVLSWLRRWYYLSRLRLHLLWMDLFPSKR